MSSALCHSSKLWHPWGVSSSFWLPPKPSAALRAFVETSYQRDGWLQASGVKLTRGARMAHRLGLLTVGPEWSEGPSASPGGLLTFGLSSVGSGSDAVLYQTQGATGVRVGAFAVEVEDGTSASAALRRSLNADASKDVLGRKLSEVIARQATLERAALDAVKLARTKLPGAWPKGIRAWFEFLSVLAPDPEARKQAALLSFLSNVGVGRTDASTMVESGKSPARAARGLAGLAAPRGMLPSIGKPLKPKPKPTTKQGAVVVRDRVLSDGEKSALTTAGVVLAGVAVLGVGYVLVRRLGR